MALKVKRTCLFCKSIITINSQTNIGYCTECGALNIDSNDLSILPENVFNEIKVQSEAGNIYSSYLLARMYFFEEDYKNAKIYLENVINEDFIADAFAMYAVSYIRARNQHTADDYKLALNMIRKAEGLGSVFLRVNGFEDGDMTFKEAMVYFIENSDTGVSSQIPSGSAQTYCCYYLNGLCTRTEPYKKCHGYCGYFHN